MEVGSFWSEDLFKFENFAKKNDYTLNTCPLKRQQQYLLLTIYTMYLPFREQHWPKRRKRVNWFQFLILLANSRLSQKAKLAQSLEKQLAFWLFGTFRRKMNLYLLSTYLCNVVVVSINILIFNKKAYYNFAQKNTLNLSISEWNRSKKSTFRTGIQMRKTKKIKIRRYYIVYLFIHKMKNLKIILKCLFYFLIIPSV